MEPVSNSVKDVLSAGAAYLESRNIQDARIIVELLVARLLNCRRLDVYLKYDTVLGDKLVEAMKRGVRRAGNGEPVQYITGQAEFLGHVFKVDKRALIPRPETETLVTEVIECCSRHPAKNPAVVDVGTGSGCIVISLAMAMPGAIYVGLDVSGDALALARENAAALGVDGKIAFACGELPDVVEPGTISVIVSNPPYIPTGECGELPVNVRDYEPRTALDGGADGLSVLEAIVQDSVFALTPGGFLFLEIGHTQAAAVKEFMEGNGFRDVLVVKDLAGRDRVVSGMFAG